VTRSGERRPSGAPLLRRDVTVDGGTAALLAATTAALVVGVAVGVPTGTAVGVAGALATLLGLARTPDADPVSRGVGSVALVVAAVLFARTPLFPVTPIEFLVVACGSLAVLSVGVGVASGGSPVRLRPALYALAGSTGIAIAAAVLAFVFGPVLAGARFAVASGVSLRGGWLPNVLLSLVLLQFLVVVLSVTIDRADAVLERWIPPDRSRGFPILDRIGVDADEIPRAVWAFLGAQLLLALLAGGVVSSVLRATPPGKVLHDLLTGGALHLPLVALIALFGGVLAVDAIRRFSMRIGGYNPPTVIGLLAGGLVAVAAAAAVAALSLAGVDASAPLAATGLVGAFGIGSPGVGNAPRSGMGALLSAAGLLLSVAGRTGAFAIALGAGTWLARNAVGRLVGALPAGVALLVAATVAGSEAGAHPVVVFAAVGLALVAFDAGTRSGRLSRRLGPDADTRSVELVHLLGGAVAAAAGVALATAALYVVVPLAAGLGDARGVMLLLAGLVGLSAALLVFGREAPEPGG